MTLIDLVQTIYLGVLTVAWIRTIYILYDVVRRK